MARTLFIGAQFGGTASGVRRRSSVAGGPLQHSGGTSRRISLAVIDAASFFHCRFAESEARPVRAGIDDVDAIWVAASLPRARAGARAAAVPCD